MPFAAIAAGIGSLGAKLLKKNPATGKSPMGSLIKKAGGLFKKKNKQVNNASPVAQNVGVLQTVAQSISSPVTKKVLKQAQRQAEYDDLQRDKKKDDSLLIVMWVGLGTVVIGVLAWVGSMVFGKKGRR